MKARWSIGRKIPERSKSDAITWAKSCPVLATSGLAP
jgi:hypothetical protein